jgi:L-2-hydroxyglutarate oxidase LhgO
MADLIADREVDVAVIGAGIVGLATADALLQHLPDLRLVVLEREGRVGAHQTGHNSGVVHSGLYYRPGSAKARLCVEGGRLLPAFCAQHGIPLERCGKVVVATTPEEVPRLEVLYERGRANGVPGLERIGPERLRELEPHATGVAALWSPGTAIVDFGAVARALAGRVSRAGGLVALGARVVGFARREGRWLLHTGRGTVRARVVVNCGGVYADRLARLAGARPDVQIVPFRGEYYRLRPAWRHLVRGLIYPVPDPAFPFLGVHLTRTVHGEVEAGPNAVLAFARDGYRLTDVRLRDVAELLRYRGWWRMVRRYWRTGVMELARSLSRCAFVRSVQRLVPAVTPAAVERHGAGVRAQAVAPDGTLVDDFRIVEAPGAVHVVNAPSPAATAALAIGRHIAALAAAHLHRPRAAVPGTAARHIGP